MYSCDVGGRVTRKVLVLSALGAVAAEALPSFSQENGFELVVSLPVRPRTATPAISY